MPSKLNLIQEYNKYKRKAKINFLNNNIERALHQIEYCALLTTYYPIFYNYIDDELETLLISISGNIFSNKSLTIESTFQNKVVFYNTQVVDAGALTEQYLEYFTENNFQILFIVQNQNNVINGLETVKKIRNNTNIEFFTPKTTNYITEIKEISEKIIEFSPSLAFLHFLPHDVIGFCSFALLNNIKRYYIVHNDHTFWLGKNCSDHFIEFRNHGYKIAIERRNIPKEKISVIPYFPIINKLSFQGFPFNSDNKIIGLSAAQLYKYFMDPDLQYFNIIKRLLIENDNFIFCLVGYANNQKYPKLISNYIKKNNLENKFFFLGKRNDFYDLVGKIDILFESYPLKGGLTLLYATEQKKAVVGIGNLKDHSGLTEDFLNISGYHQPQTLDEFYNESTRLIRDVNYRMKNAECLSQNEFNKLTFSHKLTELLTSTKAIHYSSAYTLKLDEDLVFNQYKNLRTSKYTILQFKYKKLYGYYGIVLSLLCMLNFQGFKYVSNRIIKKIFCPCKYPPLMNQRKK